jgi:glyoxylate/hydroxypyruvate reductase A
MTIAIIASPDSIGGLDAYRTILAEALPDLDIRVWPDVGDPADIRYAVVWQPEPGVLGQFPNLAGIFNLGAGVDGLMRDTTLPANVPVMRLADAGMGDQMVEYCLYGVLHFHRDMDLYRRDQAQGIWAPRPFVATGHRRVGVLGLGTLGGQVADAAAAFGFDTAGWSRSPKVLRQIRCFSGADQFDAFLARTDILVNLLPLTDATRGILNADTFAKMPRGACLVNAARGAHVVEADLLRALDDGHIRGCLLDAFDPEPLPADHPFRRHPGVIVTPHVAAQTVPHDACQQIVNNIKRLEDGRAPYNVVDRSTGY